MTSKLHRFKQLAMVLAMAFIVLGTPLNSLVTSTVYATDIVDYGSGDGNRASEDKGLDDTDKANMQAFLEKLFDSGIYSEMNINASVETATPAIVLILTVSMIIVLIAVYGFFLQTAIDLTFITIPISRGLLMHKGGNKSGGGMSMMGGGGGSSDKTYMVSDAAYEAVFGGKGGGGMLGGGGQDRGVGSALIRYAKARSTELAAFVLFIVVIFTGMIGKIVLLIFNLAFSFFSGLLKLA